MSEQSTAEQTNAEQSSAEQTNADHASRPKSRRPFRGGVLGVIAIVIAMLSLVAMNIVQSRAQGDGRVPQSAAMEDVLGVRFSRVAVVGDGGLLTVSYVVLDAQKAARFQADVKHPPVLQSEAREASTRRVSLMKQGHNIRPGQTYYLVYENAAGALRSGEQVSVVRGSLRLQHVPVL